MNGLKELLFIRIFSRHALLNQSHYEFSDIFSFILLYAWIFQSAVGILNLRLLLYKYCIALKFSVDKAKASKNSAY